MNDPIELRSTVRAVTVYRRGALVTRVARLTRGDRGYPEHVRLSGLPLGLRDSSVRVEIGSTTGSESPVAGDLRIGLSVPTPDLSLPPADNQALREAMLAKARAETALEGLRRTRAELERLAPPERGRPEEGKPPQPSPTEARLELARFRREQAERLDRAITEAAERLRVASEQLATERENERVGTSGRNARPFELRKSAELRLHRPEQPDAPGVAAPDEGEPDSIEPDSIEIVLRYRIAGARWAPAYAVRLDRAMRAGTLELRAIVGQATGEDWRDVALTLSTALPQQWAELPKLDSLRIGRRQAAPKQTGWRPAPVGAEALYGDYDRDLPPPPAPPPSAPIRRRAKASAHAELAAAAPEPQPMAAPQARAASKPMPPPSPAPAPAPVAGQATPMAEEAESAPMMTRAGGVVMPHAMAGPERRKGGFGLGAMIGGAIDGIASAFEPSFGGGGPPGSSPQPKRADETGEPEVLAARDMLDYGRLRLLPATDTRRGTLERLGDRELYRRGHASDDRPGVQRMDVALDRASARATALERRDPPAAHRWPEADAGFDYAYVADSTIDLASDGSFHALAIDARSIEATPRYVCVPRESQDVFRIVGVRNPFDAPLLPGPADVYVDGKFALTSDLPVTPASGRVELGLGVEQAIKVARNVEFTEDSSGMFKRSVQLTHAVTVELANHLGAAATVEVRERLPHVPEGSSDIELELGEVKPRWDDFEQDERPLEAGRVWTIEVPAAGERELKASWTITIPKNHELVGGNRREG